MLTLPHTTIESARICAVATALSPVCNLARKARLVYRPLGGARSPVSIHLYVENADDVYKKALAAGATSLSEPEDQFYGERNAQVRDPSGHCWDISMRIEEVSPEEMGKRFRAMANPS